MITTAKYNVFNNYLKFKVIELTISLISLFFDIISSNITPQRNGIKNAIIDRIKRKKFQNDILSYFFFRNLKIPLFFFYNFINDLFLFSLLDFLCFLF